MGEIASQITSPTFVSSTVYSDADQRKHQSSAPLAFVRGIHRGPWIPRTDGQLRRKCFHLMTSSCDYASNRAKNHPHVYRFASYTSYHQAGLGTPVVFDKRSVPTIMTATLDAQQPPQHNSGCRVVFRKNRNHHMGSLLTQTQCQK